MAQDNLSDKGPLSLTKEEQEYLSNHRAFTICEQFDIYPLSGVDDGSIIGMRGDYVEEIVRLTGLKLKVLGSHSLRDLKQKVQSNQCDLVGSLGSNQKIFPNIINTNTVMEFPYGVMGDLRSLNIAPYSDLAGRTFIVRFENIKETILKSYPDINIEVINDIDTAIAKVGGNVHFVALKPVTERVIQKYGFETYKLNGVLDKAKQKSTMGVHEDHPLLLAIINKAIARVDPLLVNSIFDKYSIKEFKIVQSYAWLWYVLIFLIVSSAFLVYRYSQLNQKKKLIEESNKIIKDQAGQLEKQNVELKKADRAKSEFLANMSHELRTPLNAIIGYSEMISEQAEIMEAAELVNDARRIRFAGGHLLELINDLLDLSKIESGKLNLDPELIALPEFLQTVIDSLQLVVDANHNRLEFVPDPDIEHIHSDAVRLRQILTNLLSNAAKFTHQGTITLSTARSDDGDEIVFTVRDTGIGMTSEQLAKVFEAFVQADSSTTKEYGGTGLGLTLCRRLSELLGGSIEAHSKVGRGSVFSLRLPAQQSGMKLRSLKEKKAYTDPR